MKTNGSMSKMNFHHFIPVHSVFGFFYTINNHRECSVQSIYPCIMFLKKLSSTEENITRSS